MDKPDQSDKVILDQTLEKLYESEQHYRTLFDNTTCGLLFANPETGEFLECNRRICEMLGYSKEELKQLSVADIHPEEDLPWVMKEFRRLANSEKSQSLNVTVKRKDGDIFYANISSFWIKYQGKECLVGAFLDVTGNKKTEQALREQKAKLAHAQKLSHIGSWELDLVNDVEHWSDEVFRIFGYAPQTFTPSESRKLESVHPDDRSKFQSHIRQGLKTREKFEFEFRLLRSNNEVRIVRSLNEVIRDREGEAVLLLGTLQDVTQRRQTDAQLRRSHEDLRRLTGYLQSARENERISIARAIHDEMAQSLTAQKIDMVRLKSMLPRDVPLLEELSEEVLQSINQTISSVQRILTELRPALLDDLGLVAAIEWQVIEFQRRTGIQYHLVLPDDELDLTLDQRTALFRIMQESLSNVLRHSNADTVWVELIVDGHWLLMSIIDNGKGISDLEVLGSRSFGLMGMHERAYILGGNVNIHGKEGKGTNVSTRIPINIKQGSEN
ncbi:MAG: PAS domain S-box protein [Gammaproteobacteria bacterium]|nr:PAS domain S-box protein [Gammaproteobacteria bacterium]MBT3723763.1 PAS domain S-box protein [Gammaproteobacteria bacterium]MBT4075782.1 PAS domain S-box protein [Gammaproteobacteria bacterium]MBT4196443.1 PAS domain S-box protein [Gammaproteobacteria bacterium]MBT4448136.1 PAS domain S-box protein [Gammaproteobacteria bacterium]